METPAYLTHFFVFVSSEITPQLRHLLEQNHLYQNLKIQLPTEDQIITEMINKSGALPENHKMPLLHVNAFIHIYDWLLIPGEVTFDQQAKNDYKIMVSMPETLECYCNGCNKLSAHNLAFVSELPTQPGNNQNRSVARKQVWVTVFVCQLCKQNSTSFLISKKVAQQKSGQNDQSFIIKLQIAGRSPVENIDIPVYIPKDEKRQILFRDSCIAFNSNQTLAAISLLRIFLEQFIRGQISDINTENVSDLINEYYKILDLDFKAKAPSLSKIYGHLSESIHTANKDENVYFQSRLGILLFFKNLKLLQETNDFKNSNKQ
jgi:hypothetical protein